MSKRLLPLLAFASFVLLARSASAARAPDFTCPGGFPLYNVYSASTGEFGGVRCVGFMQSSDPRVVEWYAEGSWGGFLYRNLGDATTGHPGPDGFTWVGASSSDIWGNGENAQGHTTNLSITTSVRPGNWDGVTPPAVIRIGGDWDEVWYYSGASYSWTFVSPLPPMTACQGTNLSTAVDWDIDTSTDQWTQFDSVCEMGPGYWAGPAISFHRWRMYLFSGASDLYATQVLPGVPGSSDLGDRVYYDCNGVWPLDPRQDCGHGIEFGLY